MENTHSTIRKWHVALLALLLAALACGIFAQTARHGFSVLDDDDYVVKNIRVQDGLTWQSVKWAMTTDAVANWHPLTWLSHMLDFQIFGLAAAGPHMVNVFFHAINSILLFLVFRAMTGATTRSFILAALFAVHPLHVESVAWIAERKDVLSAFFWIAAMGAYTRYTRRPGVLRYLLVAILFAFGLTAKPMLVTLPCVFLLLDFWPLRRLNLWRDKNGNSNSIVENLPNPGKKPKKATQQPLPKTSLLRADSPVLLFFEKLPLFAISAASSVITFVVQQRGGAMRTLEAMPPLQRLGNVFVAYLRYASKALWPADLAVYYPHLGAEMRWWSIAAAAAALIIVSLLIWRVASERRYLSVGWLWFLGTLVPVIGIVQVGSQSIADRYMYLPIIGLLVMAVWGVNDVAVWLRTRMPRLPAFWPRVLGGAAVAGYAACAFVTTGYWRDNVTLFEHALKSTTNNDFVHYNLGIALKRANRNDEALAHFQEAVNLRNSYVAARIYIGLIHYEKNEYEAAIKEYEQALEFAAGHPNHADIENDLGVAYFSLGKMEEAANHYRKAVEIHPEDPDAHYNLALTLQRLNRFDEAFRQAREAVRCNPHHEPARNLAASLEKEAAARRPAIVVPKLANADEYFTRGNALADEKKFAEAAAHYEEALKLNPDFNDARINLGNALAVQGRLREAVEQFRESSRRMPSNSDVFLNLGHALTELGDLPQAAEAYQRAATLNTRNVEAWIGLGFALARQNKPEAARGPFLKVLALDPNNARAKEALTNIDQYLGKKH